MSIFLLHQKLPLGFEYRDYLSNILYESQRMQRLITSSLPTYQSPLSCFLRTSVAKDTRIFLRQCLNIMGPLALGIALDQHALLHPDTIGISIPEETKQKIIRSLPQAQRILFTEVVYKLQADLRSLYEEMMASQFNIKSFLKVVKEEKRNPYTKETPNMKWSRLAAMVAEISIAPIEKPDEPRCTGRRYANYLVAITKSILTRGFHEKWDNYHTKDGLIKGNKLLSILVGVIATEGYQPVPIECLSPYKPSELPMEVSPSNTITHLEQRLSCDLQNIQFTILSRTMECQPKTLDHSGFPNCY